MALYSKHITTTKLFEARFYHDLAYLPPRRVPYLLSRSLVSGSMMCQHCTRVLCHSPT